MRLIGQRQHGSVAQVALAWLLAKSHVTSILLGASRVSQLNDNLGCLKVQLTDSDLKELDEFTSPGVQYPNWFQSRTLDQAVADALKHQLFSL